MAIENAKRFVEMVAADAALKARLETLDSEAVLAAAKEMGLDFTAEELKAAAMDETVSLDELEQVSGGKTYYDNRGNRVDATGKAMTPETLKSHTASAKLILAFSRNDWDWVEGGLRELGYDIEQGELKKLGLDNWAQREKERITGIVERNEYRGN